MVMLYPWWSLATGVGSGTQGWVRSGEGDWPCLVRGLWQREWRRGARNCPVLREPGETLPILLAGRSPRLNGIWKRGKEGSNGWHSEAGADGVSRKKWARGTGCHGLPWRALFQDLSFQHHPGWSPQGAQTTAARERRELPLTESPPCKAFSYSLYGSESS